MEVPARFLPPQVQISNAIRKFLVDINRLTRIYIARTLLNVGVQPTKDAVNERFRSTVAEFRNLLLEYYGEDISNQVQNDSLTFINHFEQMVDAYAKRDENAIEQSRNALYFLANQYAQRYALINNYFDRNVILALFYEWINLAENQIVSLLNKDYARELKEYDEFMNVTYRMSDEFIYGMLRQFFYF